MNGKGGSTRGLISVTMLAFAARDRRKLQKTSVEIAGGLAEIRTEDFQ